MPICMVYDDCARGYKSNQMIEIKGENYNDDYIIESEKFSRKNSVKTPTAEVCKIYHSVEEEWIDGCSDQAVWREGIHKLRKNTLLW